MSWIIAYFVVAGVFAWFHRDAFKDDWKLALLKTLAWPAPAFNALVKILKGE